MKVAMSGRLIAIYVLQGQGYVWDAEGDGICAACARRAALASSHLLTLPSAACAADARCLRLEHGMVGAMVGGVAGGRVAACRGAPLPPLFAA